MSKLWQTNSTSASDDFVEQFTVGYDYIHDQELVPYEILASKAHANMLQSIGVLTVKENTSLQKALTKLSEIYQKGKFEITREQEDCQTAIEQFLTEECGEAGKKIHTGRSRNDQALVEIRLFTKEKSAELKKLTEESIAEFRAAAKESQNVQMPGYTHMQRAMPTTVGIWLNAFADAAEESIPFFDALQNMLDQNPLGSASGFGVRNFSPNREMTTKELGFAKVQENPIFCGISRGSFEKIFLDVVSQPVLAFSRFVNDLLFFTSDGKNYFTLPDFLTTGSSIMPQKRNFDPGEIFRGKVVQFLAAKQELENLQNAILSGYNRDMCLTKEAFFRGFHLGQELIQMAGIFAKNLEPNEKGLASAMTEDLFITEKIYEYVKEGIPFREAYRKVKEEFFQK